MKLAVTGSSGLVGSHLMPLLIGRGDDVIRLVRSRPQPGKKEIQWDPTSGDIALTGLEGLNGVVHLAGENIATGRWNTQKKKRIRDSRVQGTRLLAEYLTKLEPAPTVMVSASAIGFYGNRGAEQLTEESSPGDDFLAEVCQEWEKATEPLRKKEVRVVNLRFGVILSPSGGALKKMLLPFRMGLGGRVGDGRQYMSWISLDDVLHAILHTLSTDSLQGPVNVVSPHPLTNGEFTKILGRVLSRPTLFPMPAFAARLVFGEMADALLLSSTRVEPSGLLKSGYQFKHTELETTLRHLLHKVR